jgi:hypothetical protein
MMGPHWVAIRTSVMNLVVAAIACGVLLSVVLAQQPAPDLVLFNGEILTSKSKQLPAEALAIRGERIVAMGSSQEISALAGGYLAHMTAEEL